MESNQNTDYKSAKIESDALHKSRKRPRSSPQNTKTQNENKYQMADGREPFTEPPHKYTATCESFIEDVENGFITNSITDVFSESILYERDQCASNKNIQTLDDHKCETIELYTNFEPQEGRPILNTSMIRFANQTTQQKGRSPLTAVDNQNSVQCVSTQKKYMPTISSDETFNYYQRKVPHNPTGIDHFGRLSYEMILSIFQWLPKKALMRCSLVCKRFNVITQDESLWGRLDLAGKNLNVGALGRILRRGLVVLRLAQTKIGSPIFEDETNSFTCTKLQYLDLSMADISLTSLAELLGKCKNLKKLSLETVPVDSAICQAIAANRHLVALNMTMCTGLVDDGIRKLFTDLRSLQNLNISWTSLTVECIEVFLQCVPTSLIRLNIAGCRKSMTDLHIANLVVRCPDLIELDISDCINLTSDTILQIAKLKHLEYLSMSRCYNVTPTSYVSLNELLSLAFLDIFGVLSDDAIKLLQNKFPAVGINKFIHSAVARPTVGSRRTSIWGLRTRDV